MKRLGSRVRKGLGHPILHRCNAFWNHVSQDIFDSKGKLVEIVFSVIIYLKVLMEKLYL